MNKVTGGKTCKFKVQCVKPLQHDSAILVLGRSQELKPIIAVAIMCPRHKIIEDASSFNVSRCYKFVNHDWNTISHFRITLCFVHLVSFDAMVEIV